MPYQRYTKDGEVDKRHKTSKANASKAREILKQYIAAGKNSYEDEYEIDIEMKDPPKEPEKIEEPPKEEPPKEEPKPEIPEPTYEVNMKGVDGYNPNQKPPVKPPIVPLPTHQAPVTEQVPPIKTEPKEKKKKKYESSSSDSDSSSEDERVRRKMRKYKKKIKKLEKTQQPQQPTIVMMPQAELNGNDKYAKMIRNKMFSQFGLN